ncbi:hypothetical protein [Tsukamurella sp. NPDC003166]|uniref:hypothetical protein n=1 Tax=Tsukamurella sp. NPDC003166 TaxID=3154444 RepID=UPI0033A0F78D
MAAPRRMCSQPYLRWQDPMALNFYGRDDRLTRQLFLDGGERLGLRPRATARMLDDLVDAAPGYIDRCDEIGFDDATTARLTDFLRKRLTTLT